MGGYHPDIERIRKEIIEVKKYLISRANNLMLTSEEEFSLIERIGQLKRDIKYRGL